MDEFNDQLHYPRKLHLWQYSNSTRTIVKWWRCSSFSYQNFRQFWARGEKFVDVKNCPEQWENSAWKWTFELHLRRYWARLQRNSSNSTSAGFIWESKRTRGGRCDLCYSHCYNNQVIDWHQEWWIVLCSKYWPYFSEEHHPHYPWSSLFWVQCKGGFRRTKIKMKTTKYC